MKKLLLTLLCVPLIFSCVDNDKTKKLEDRITELEKKTEKTVMEQKAIDECTKTLNEISVKKEEHIPIVIRDLFMKELEELCNCLVEKKGIYWGDLGTIGISKLCGSKELQRKA